MRRTKQRRTWEDNSLRCHRLGGIFLTRKERSVFWPINCQLSNCLTVICPFNNYQFPFPFFTHLSSSYLQSSHFLCLCLAICRFTFCFLYLSSARLPFNVCFCYLLYFCFRLISIRDQLTWESVERVWSVRRVQKALESFSAFAFLTLKFFTPSTGNKNRNRFARRLAIRARDEERTVWIVPRFSATHANTFFLLCLVLLISLWFDWLLNCSWKQSSNRAVKNRKYKNGQKPDHITIELQEVNIPTWDDNESYKALLIKHYEIFAKSVILFWKGES